MKPTIPIVAAAALAFASPVRAQMIVHDPTSYAGLLREAQTALDQLGELRAQLDEARRLHASLNTASGAGGLAAALSSPALRKVLPGAEQLAAAAQGDLARLGPIGEAAGAIRDANRLFTAPAGDPAGQDLERAGDRAARDLALGQAIARAGGDRLEGLQDLLDHLDAAPNARAVLDLQARIAAEQALAANDQMRVQGLAMAQAAEAQLQAQRDRERAAADREARLAFYRRAFR